MRERLQIFPSLRLALLLLGTLSPALRAQDSDPYKTKPNGHVENKQTAARAHEANLKKFAGDQNVLVLPGLVADKTRKRVEVLVERTGVGRDAPCEFTVIAESSDHAYEALLIAFAEPSDVHRALEFIGTKAGESLDPATLRFWAKGESFTLSLARTNGPPFRLETLLMDKRTGKPLPAEGFLFTGSRMLPDRDDPAKKVYAADEHQPKSIVSLFNSPFSVLEVPYSAAKGDVYQNTIVNPAHELPEGALLTLIFEPASKNGSKRVKDLALEVQSTEPIANPAAPDVEQLKSLSVQLKDSDTVLNDQPTLISAIARLAALDRKRHDHFLSVRFGGNVALGQARALARILSTIDREQGIRIDPPPSGQIYYRAFTPDRELLDRDARLDHPWELLLSEADGRVSGRLLLVTSVWKNDATRSELEFAERPVYEPKDLRRALDAEIAEARKENRRSKPEVIMVFASSTLTYGKLMQFLEPALPTHRIVHVYLDEPMPPVPPKKTSP
jgi:hypothetical protein